MTHAFGGQAKAISLRQDALFDGTEWGERSGKIALWLGQNTNTWENDRG